MSRIFTRGTTTLIVCSHGIALFLEHMDDEQEPKISSEISPHINDKQLGRLNSYIYSHKIDEKFDIESFSVIMHGLLEVYVIPPPTH